MITKKEFAEWIEKHGVIDKDRIISGEENVKKLRKQANISSLECEAEIDLHNVLKCDVGKYVDDFIEECEKAGLKKVKIVHGKGLHSEGKKSAIYQAVISCILSNTKCGKYGFCSPKDGGEGATWVMIEGNASK